jgi:hypothetical protein
MVKNHESTRYSGLDQANASNVAALRVAMGRRRLSYAGFPSFHDFVIHQYTEARGRQFNALTLTCLSNILALANAEVAYIAGVAYRHCRTGIGGSLRVSCGRPRYSFMLQAREQRANFYRRQKLLRFGLRVDGISEDPAEDQFRGFRCKAGRKG